MNTITTASIDIAFSIAVDPYAETSVMFTRSAKQPGLTIHDASAGIGKYPSVLERSISSYSVAIAKPQVSKKGIFHLKAVF